MKLELQINSRLIGECPIQVGGAILMITPPINENYWLYRVPLSETQAIVGFPKFRVIGIGFQKETDWNTDLPSVTDALEIYEHIKHNKGDRKIRKEHCLEAIRMIQRAALEARRNATIKALESATDDTTRLDLLGDFLRKTGNYAVAQVFGR